jgi:hypothetical protein
MSGMELGSEVCTASGAGGKDRCAATHPHHPKSETAN